MEKIDIEFNSVMHDICNVPHEQDIVYYDNRKKDANETKNN